MDAPTLILTALATITLIGVAVFFFLRAESRDDLGRKPRPRSHHDSAHGKDRDVAEGARGAWVGSVNSEGGCGPDD